MVREDLRSWIFKGLIGLTLCAVTQQGRNKKCVSLMYPARCITDLVTQTQKDCPGEEKAVKPPSLDCWGEFGTEFQETHTPHCEIKQTSHQLCSIFLGYSTNPKYTPFWVFNFTHMYLQSFMSCVFLSLFFFGGGGVNSFQLLWKTPAPCFRSLPHHRFA